MSKGGPRRAIAVPLVVGQVHLSAPAPPVQTSDASSRSPARRVSKTPAHASREVKRDGESAEHAQGRGSAADEEKLPRLNAPPAALGHDDVEPDPMAPQVSELSRALLEMREYVTKRWGSVSNGAQFLSTCDVDGNGLFGVESLHTCLKEEGYPRSLGEVCCLFMALGVPCGVQAKVTAENFLRLHAIEANVKKHADGAARAGLVFKSLQFLRVTLSNITPPELMLMLIYMGFCRECGEIPHETKPSLREALRRMRRYLVAFVGISRGLCDALTSTLGLQIMSRVITSSLVEKSLKLEAITLLSHAIAVTGGHQFEVRSVVDQAVLEKWSGKGYEHLQKLLQSPGASLQTASARSNASPRAKARAAPVASLIGDMDAVASFAEHLTREFWHPVLVAYDSGAASKGLHPIDADVLDALHVIFRQLHLTDVLIKPECQELRAGVEDIVLRLHATPVHEDDADDDDEDDDDDDDVDLDEDHLDDFEHIAESLELLEEMHGSVSNTLDGREVHTLVAAYGGYRFLSDRIANLTLLEAGDPTAIAMLELSTRWCTEKDKLLRRWRPTKQVGAMAKLGALARAVATASAEGFQEVWQAVLTGTQQLGTPADGSKMMTLPTAWHPVHGRGIERKLLSRLTNRWERARSPEFVGHEEQLNQLVGHGNLQPARSKPQASLSARGRLFATPWKVDTTADQALRPLRSKGPSTEIEEHSQSIPRPRPKRGRGVEGWSYSALKWQCDEKQSDEQPSARRSQQRES
mmetsp:Transcript_48164/g.108193  ORF Transcript_48164/g.108193 Transcript_48164/m.108193 type:complete len:753 (+) Transcript_48164:118-2376(+)